MQNKEMFLLKKFKEIYINVFLQIYVMDNSYQKIIDIIGLQMLLAIKYNFQKGDRFVASEDILVFVPSNRKIFVWLKCRFHAKISHLKVKIFRLTFTFFSIANLLFPFCIL